MIFAVCFLISCVIWLYVTGIENGEFEYTFTDVVVNIDGASALLDEKGLSLISDQVYKVNITVKGYRSEIMKYGADDFFAYVDVDTISEVGTHSLNIITRPPAGDVTVVSTSPSAVNVFVDETATKKVPIVPALHYSIADTLTMHDPVPEVDTIEITGPKTRIDLIEYARVEYDLGTVTTSTNFKAPVKICDSLGNQVINPYIKSSLTEVMVKIKVTGESSVPLVAEYTADDADEYDYKIVFFTESLKLTGDTAILAKFDKLTVKLGNITAVKTGSIPVGSLNIPGELTLVDGETIQSVSFTVEKTPKTPIS